MDNIRSSKSKISHSSDIGEISRQGKTLSEAIGFDDKTSGKIELVIRELGSNIVKHAGTGIIKISEIEKDGQPGIQIESLDEGPGIREQDFQDGYSTSASLGYGLGTVNRIMDEIDITSSQKKGSGSHLTGRLWLKPAYSNGSDYTPFFDIGAASRPHPKMTENGDDFFIKQWESGAFVAVIDGVGHGKHASQAAKRASGYLRDHYHQPFESLIKGLDRTCRSTRGVVIAMIRFDMIGKTLEFTGIGNIEIKSRGLPGPASFITHRGIIGTQVPKPYIRKFEWHDGAWIVLHSDGIPARWDRQHYDLLNTNDSSFGIALKLLQQLGKNDDDATVIVIKENK